MRHDKTSIHSVKLGRDPLSEPKLHHFAPQFYLRRFADASGLLWAWDKKSDRVFSTRASGIAAERDFYFHSGLRDQGHDPLTMEKQFAELEHGAATITARWLARIRASKLGESLDIPEEDRDTVALHLALQFLRTADTRDTMTRLVIADGHDTPSRSDARSNHLALLWDDEIVDSITSRIGSLFWIFAKNSSSTSLVTSDNPVAFRSGDNHMWLKASIFSPGTYLTHPLAPDVVMYGYPDEGKFQALRPYDGCISQVELSDGMVSGDNTAHVFMSSRHVISSSPEFDWARDFKEAIADGRYAPPEYQGAD